MRIVIPAAGRGTRMNSETPKPLINVDGKTMIERVISNIGFPSRTIVICQKSHNLPCKDKIEIDFITAGSASSCYLAKGQVDPNEELIIVNCDQIIQDFNLTIFLKFVNHNNLDVCVGTFFSNSVKNSYVKLDGIKVTDIKEKVVISDVATNGLHYWKKSKYFFDSYESLMPQDAINGEFYVSSIIKKNIVAGLHVGAFHYNLHFPIGTKEDLDEYLSIK